MKQMVKISEFLQMICYCIKILWNTSKRYFVTRMILNIASLVIPFVVIAVTRQLINFLAENSAAAATVTQTFVLLSILLLGCNILSKAIETANTYYMGLHQDIMETKTKQLIMEKAAELDLSYFDSAEFYNEMQDANANSSLITFSAFRSIEFIRYFLQFLVAFVYLFQFGFILPIIFVLAVIPYTIVDIKQVAEVYGFQRKYMAEERKMQYAADVLLSREFAKDVRIYNIASFICGKFLGIWNMLFSKKKKISLRYTRLLLALLTLPEIVAASFLFFLGLSVIQGGHSIGDFTYLQGLMGQILGSIYMVISSYTQLMDGKIRIQNFRKFLGFENKVCSDGMLPLAGDSFSIEFRDVSFRYGDDLPWILKNVSFSFHSKQKIAFVGVNGSGKTTIVKLLLRFYEPVKGQILVNGKDLREYGIDSFRCHFSTVFQDYSNYAFTVKESVSLSDIGRADDGNRVMEALRQSGADAFTVDFLYGVDTYLTRRYEENGQELSGGQWQKMAIARAFFREADIYILDEPSASLDAKSEDEVFGMFHEMYEGKGAVLISHRLSNVHLSDLIFVLDNGSLVEKGTHGELMKEDGVYAQMYRLQAEKYHCA